VTRRRPGVTEQAASPARGRRAVDLSKVCAVVVPYP
jgi:hypothetical protein